MLAKAAVYRGAPRPGAGLPVDAATVRELLRNPRIVLTPVQRADLLAGGIDPRLIATLAAIGRRHTVDHHRAARPTTTPAPTTRPAGRWTSAPSTASSADGGRAGACAQLVRELAAVEGETRSTELIYCWDPDGPADPRGFARADHCDHIHWGMDARSRACAQR